MRRLRFYIFVIIKYILSGIKKKYDGVHFIETNKFFELQCQIVVFFGDSFMRSAILSILLTILDCINS
jgi:hypothetical protein